MKLLRKIYGQLKLLKEIAIASLRKPVNIYDSLAEFITPDVSVIDITQRINSVLKQHKVSYYDVYDMMKTVAKLKKQVPNERDVYKIILTTSAEMDADADLLTRSALYYCGVFATFNKDSEEIITSKIEDKDKETKATIKFNKEQIREHKATIKSLEQVIRNLEKDNVSASENNKEFATKMIGQKNLIRQLTNKGITELKNERGRYKKYF